MQPLALLTRSIVKNNVLSIRHESRPFRGGAGWVGFQQEESMPGGVLHTQLAIFPCFGTKNLIIDMKYQRSFLCIPKRIPCGSDKARKLIN